MRRQRTKRPVQRVKQAKTGGTPIHCPPSIRPYTAIPIWQMTVGWTDKIRSANGEYFLFITDVISAIGAQLNSAKDNILIAVQSLMVYNTSGKSMTVNFREMQPDGVANNPNSSLYTIADYGSPITYPAVGYRYPLAQRQKWLSSADTQTTIANITGLTNDQLVFRASVNVRIR